MMQSEDKLCVVVLFGGMSSEHEVSRVSAGTFVDNLDRARYEAWENSPGGDDDYDARLLKAWNNPDALESLSADSPLWNMDVNDGAYETERELDWGED